MAVTAYQGVKLGSALATVAVRLYGQPGTAVLEPAGMTAKLRAKIGMPAGAELLQRRAFKQIDGWVTRELRDGRIRRGDVKAAIHAVEAALRHFGEDPSRAAMLATINRKQLAQELLNAGAEHKRALGNAPAQLIFDRLLEACITELQTLVPIGDQRVAAGLKLVEEWSIEAQEDIKAELDALAQGRAGIMNALDVGLDEVHQAAHKSIQEISWIRGEIALLRAEVRVEFDNAFDHHQLNNPPRDPPVIVKANSAARMARYLALTNGNASEAMRLYQWNREVSGELYRSIYVLEIALRNAMDQQLRTFNASQDALGREEWSLYPVRLIEKLGTPRATRLKPDPESRIHESVVKATNVARARANSPAAEPTHDDVIAQTTLRLWRGFLPAGENARRKALWRECLKGAFPFLHLPPVWIGAQVESIVNARNRVAHLEPFLSLRRLRDTANAIDSVLWAINPEVAHWQQSTQRLTVLMSHSVARQVGMN